MTLERTRKVGLVLKAYETLEGAGVRLKRVFGGTSTAKFTDPFLLLDHFGSNKVEDYIAGFPWHPHRGIETVTYLLEGKVEHQDSEGNKGVIYPNDLQWMTAGSGIFHQEMPRPLDQKNEYDLLQTVGLPTSVVGFQLWINLPAKSKMSTPTYRGIKGKNVPVEPLEHGGKVKVVAGEFKGVQGVLEAGASVDPSYFDVVLPPEGEFTTKVKNGYTVIAYVVSGSGTFDDHASATIGAGNAVVYSQEGNSVWIRASEKGLRLLLFSGRPIREPIAWYGPIVMNTKEEIIQALEDLRRGTFVKQKHPVFVE
ncbi:hypothetical protein B9P99_01390 [Candidatus Marsarchaeota G1 archaeon OSP_B]|jgi:redox-sensitive bicupin YhaK (pirin superfamily)|uniref:Pirin n=4 Tax=Candidatus Marsarchaeota group 1 TaxID=2203770 RepID=A0A2R6AEF6_9ARCH|nr:MAG: hypothetical protein B9Q01_08810 [Candidatus Marsarchaeota G1 archaeon OSP_D]PSN84764.1 MAG: hypothetical protein B9Q02_08885 [Candidatus Marsarchaeota G1 archaeon BE_D]PSN87020.1 MAG: hypothetical protein B9Q00_09945 [Candidatus Marsarchaeota G1 archaeon OSP_C]PSN95010.1 MAG: hypothetical protein B9P99_01390 [Candidatus Marsarchaeota G1 archaeon OSP_B]